MEYKTKSLIEKIIKNYLELTIGKNVCCLDIRCFE